MRRISVRPINPLRRTCLLIRYGAFGDMLQAASVFPLLKEEGYHLTVNVCTRGYGVVKHDPNVDAWIVQDDDEVPNEKLSEYWQELGKDFDRVINLSECTEGTLLLVPGRRTFVLPKPARHAICDVNYQEFIHMMAGVDMHFQGVFHATKTEKKKAASRRRGMGPGPVILWALAGSSVHKTYPFTDAVVAKLLKTTAAKVVFVGDELCQILEVGWENEKRVICKSGKWSIRETLAFVNEADIIVGPETGVLNAAANLPVPKVVLLSHSTEENLSKHWQNATAIVPDSLSAPCYPCHRLHYTREFCPIDEPTNAALCAASIDPERVFQAISEHAFKRIAA